MPMFDDALVSDHAHGRGLLVPFVPMPWLTKMNVFFGGHYQRLQIVLR